MYDHRVIEHRKQLARRLMAIMMTSFNGTGLIDAKKICDELGLDIRMPANKLAPIVEGIANGERSNSHG